MASRMNKWSFWLVVFCWLLSLYSYYSFRFMSNTWLLAPHAVVILIAAALAAAAGFMGCKAATNGWAIFRSFTTIPLSIILSIVLFLVIVIPWSQHILTSESPNHVYKLDFYALDSGAMTSFVYEGYLEGPLWLKKKIFTGSKRPNVKWINQNTVLINGKVIHLK